MANGVTMRLQREVTQHLKKLERIETKINESINRLRQEMEQMNADIKHMFDQIMLKFERRNCSKVVVELTKEVDKSKKGSSASESKSMRSNVPRNPLDLVEEEFLKNCKYGRLNVHVSMDQTSLGGC